MMNNNAKNNSGKAVEIEELRLSFELLSLYRQLLEDPVLGKLYALTDMLTRVDGSVLGFLKCYSEFYKALCENEPGVSLTDYVANAALYHETVFARKAEKLPYEKIEPSLTSATATELGCLQKVAIASPAFFKAAVGDRFSSSSLEKLAIESLPEWAVKVPHEADGSKNPLITVEEWARSVPLLAAFYHKNGAGIFARFNGFIWESEGGTRRLKGIHTPDPIRLKDMIGYEAERGIVLENTLKFLRGGTANNMLLYGDRGTGKSSTVKALLSEYASSGLRMIEIQKRHLGDLPEIIKKVQDRGLRFIFFIDDLSFEETGDSFTALKAVLEGGLSVKPSNVAIYATSNRRHLVRERFSDRAGLSSTDEVNAADTMEEKLSLSDRFAITVTFSAPDQNKYLAIVDGLALQKGLTMEAAELHREAVKWAMWHNGRSPRSARQFIDWLSSPSV